jgi:hypothetical protein
MPVVGEFVEEGLRLLMLQDATLVSYIDDRWYNEQLAQGSAFPAVTVQQISSVPFYSHSGHSLQEDALFQITVYAVCSLIARRVVAQIDRVIRQKSRGSFPGGIKFGRMVRTNSINHGKDPGQDIARWTLDVSITHQVYE